MAETTPDAEQLKTHIREHAQALSEGDLSIVDESRAQFDDVDEQSAPSEHAAETNVDRTLTDTRHGNETTVPFHSAPAVWKRGVDS